MCNVGDIIVIKNYIHNGTNLSKHSFVILSDTEGRIHGLGYDIICNVMSSFKNEDQRKKKLSYPGNFPIEYGDSTVDGNNKSGYIKAEQLYYFNKEKIDYVVIGRVNEDTFKLLLEFIEKLDEIKNIIDNL